MLSKSKEQDPGYPRIADVDLYDRVFYRCVIGSQAYGLADADSDVDRRGIYLPAADQQWSLASVPEHLERTETQEFYWELKKFLALALKANPHVLECLYTPLVETATPLANELLEMRDIFLTRMAYQTYNEYALSQFRKAQADMRNYGHVRWKHIMHIIRLLLSGIGVMRDGAVPVRVDAHRERLLEIKRGEAPWDEVDSWRLDLHAEFEAAFAASRLPDSPNYERTNDFLIRARRLALLEDLP
jgi:predicted nucleotidyltransferase